MGDDYVDLYGDLDEIHENEELEAVSVNIPCITPLRRVMPLFRIHMHTEKGARKSTGSGEEAARSNRADPPADSEQFRTGKADCITANAWTEPTRHSSIGD